MAISREDKRPRWMTALAIPTFIMLVWFLVFVGWLLSVVAFNTWEASPPDWMYWFVAYPLLALCLLLWPVYIAWAIRSRFLASHEKTYWIVMIVVGNIVGMPIFYVFMRRRYQGIDTHIRPKEAVRVEKFCATHSLRRTHLTQRQYHLLLKYVRQVHLARWALVPVVFASIFLIYMACWKIPQLGLMISSDWLPMTQRIVVAETNAIVQESVPEQEVVTRFLYTVMMFGAGAGVFCMLAIMVVGQSISQLFTVRRSLFIEFLQATDSLSLVSDCEEDVSL